MQFKFKILLQSTFMVMLSLIFMVGLCYFSAKNFLLSNQKNLSEETFNQCCQMSDNFKMLIENIVYSSIEQPDFISIIDDKDYQSFVHDELEAIRSMNLNIAGIHLYTYNGMSYNSDRFSSFYTLNDYLRMDRYDEFLKSPEKSIWLYNNITEDKVVFTCKIFRNNKEIGFIQTDIRIETFLNFFSLENQNNNSSTFIYYMKENVLFLNDEISDYDKIKRDVLEMIAFNERVKVTENKKVFLMCQQFINDELYIVRYASLEGFYSRMDKLKLIFFIISFLLLLVVNITYYRLIGKMMDSLYSLREKIRQYHH